MKENREVAISATLKWEGGYSNNPSDPGGPTNHGITIADAKRYWKKDATAVDVMEMPKSVAIEIYRNKYWKTKYYDCDNLDSGVDLAVFDFGVNSGPSRSKKYLDQSVGGTAEETINRIFDARVAFLKGLKTFPTFGKGWMNRCTDLRKVSLKLAKMPNKGLSNPPQPLPTAAAGGIGLAIVAALTGIVSFWHDIVNFITNLF